MVTAFFSRFSCIFFNCSACLERSWARWENSCSSFFCACCAGGASRRIRSRLTKPMLVWPRAGPAFTRSAAKAQPANASRFEFAVNADMGEDYTGASEYVAKGELESLQRVSGPLVQRPRDAEFQGPDGRVPGEAYPPRRAHLRQGHSLVRRVHLPCIDEDAEPHRAIERVSRHRKQELAGRVELAA